MPARAIALNDEATRTEAAEIVRAPIDLCDQLAGILALASGSQKPATGMGDGLLAAEQIKLVSGA